jgi:hypothetical protein
MTLSGQLLLHQPLMVKSAEAEKNMAWEVGWAGLGWAGLGWAGLGWAGLGWAGLGCGLLSGGQDLPAAPIKSFAGHWVVPALCC